MAFLTPSPPYGISTTERYGATPRIGNRDVYLGVAVSREEPKALRRALKRFRRKREKSRDVDRSDVAAVSEGKHSGESLEKGTRAHSLTTNGGVGGAYKESI